MSATNENCRMSRMINSTSLKEILMCCCFLFLFLMMMRSAFSNSEQNSILEYLMSINEEETNSCTKIPSAVANTVVHYATSNITPQQTIEEISVSLKVLKKKSPCNFLVFGLGRDSLMWAALNHGGRTVFLEEDDDWIKRQSTSLESYHVVYDTKLSEEGDLHEEGMQDHCKVVSDPRVSKCRLALKGLPTQVYDVQWDLIMIDAPTGYHQAAPGRMTAIYTAGLMARNRRNGDTDVFVHDINRAVEDRFSKSFLCQGYVVEQQHKIRHFNIPNHAAEGTPFCPH